MDPRELTAIRIRRRRRTESRQGRRHHAAHRHYDTPPGAPREAKPTPNPGASPKLPDDDRSLQTGRAAVQMIVIAARAGVGEPLRQFGLADGERADALLDAGAGA